MIPLPCVSRVPAGVRGGGALRDSPRRAEQEPAVEAHSQPGHQREHQQGGGGVPAQVQVVRVGQCVRPGRRCAGAAQGPRYGQESECRQLYLDTRLVARSPDTGALTTDTFSFPSCCACHLRNTRGAGRGTLKWTGFR